MTVLLITRASLIPATLQKMMDILLTQKHHCTVCIQGGVVLIEYVHMRAQQHVQAIYDWRSPGLFFSYKIINFICNLISFLLRYGLYVLVLLNILYHKQNNCKIRVGASMLRAATTPIVLGSSSNLWIACSTSFLKGKFSKGLKAA